MSVQKFVMSLAMLIAMGVSVPQASADWVETFTGGFDQAWFIFDNDGNMPPSDTTVSTAGNALSFSGGLVVGPIFDTSVAGIVPTESFTDVRVRATVSAIPGITFAATGALGNNDVFVAARSDGAESYLLSLDLNDGDVDLVYIDSIGGVNGLAFTIEDPAWFAAGEAYDLELTVVGTSLTGRIFDSGGSLLETINATNATLASGFSGVGAAVNNDSIALASWTVVATQFDDVSSIGVPEPSSILLALGGIFLGLTARRRR